MGLLRDMVALIVFLLPVLTLFWKIARYSAKMEGKFEQKDKEISSLKDRLAEVESKNISCYNKIQTDVSVIRDTSQTADSVNIKQNGLLDEHGLRITKLEDKTEAMCETLTQIREENSKQTAMLELLVSKN